MTQLRELEGSPTCSGCHHPFAEPDLCMLVFALEEDTLVGAYHFPCYERADRLGKHRAVVALSGLVESPPPALEEEVFTFGAYVRAFAEGEAEELDDDEIAERWPLVTTIMAEQRSRSRGSAN